MKRLLALILNNLFLFLFVSPAHAFQIGDVFQPARSGRFNTFGGIATTIITVLTSLAASLAVIMIIVGGIKFITAGGDEKKMQSATSTITYAIIGLIVTALAFIILQLVKYLLGSNVRVT